MPFTSVGGTYPIQYSWTDGADGAANARVAACGAIARGDGAAATQLTPGGWVTAIAPRASADGAPVRPPLVDEEARYNTLRAWVVRSPDSARVFAELAEGIRIAESDCHALPTATSTAPLVAMPAGTTSAIAINSDMTGDLCWLIVAMRLHPTLAVAIRIGSTEKHLRVCAAMIEQLVVERLGRRTILITGPEPVGAVPGWAARTKVTHWHPVAIARASLPVAATHVESCLTTSRRVFEAAAAQALDEQRSVADVACELFRDRLIERLPGSEKTAIDGAVRTLTQTGCLSTHAGYILLANRLEAYNHQHNTSLERFNAVHGARGGRRLVTFGRPRDGGDHIDLYANHARTDAQRAYFWTVLKATMRGLGRDVVIVGGRSGTFDIAYHAGEEPTGGGLCWDIAVANPRDPEVDRLQQQAGPGSVSGLSLATVAATAKRANGGGQVGDIAATLTALLAAGGGVRNATFAGPATTIAGAESQAMRNAEAARYAFQRATSDRVMPSAALGTSPTLFEQVVSGQASKEANKQRLGRVLGILPYPIAVPKPSAHAFLFRCPACGNTQPSKAKYLAHRAWERHY